MLATITSFCTVPVGLLMVRGEVVVPACAAARKAIAADAWEVKNNAQAARTIAVE
jgi:hypothetical protein